ncbi:hypothetical protein [Brevibacillus daliensis]|uniref:hypothetical protein n=1 Tax=Brevibacillus daliensis TaxID=2892995 RepID=UPI001E40DED0|nr:hypothetical protein [Brevibacillus daliensis]
MQKKGGAMMEKVQLLQNSIKQYGLNPNQLVFEKELHSTSWHGDLHFKIHVDNKSYSARLITFTIQGHL